MKFVLNSLDIKGCTAEFDGNPEFQGGLLPIQDEGTVAAAAVALQQVADVIGATVTFTEKPQDPRYDRSLLNPG